MVAESREIRETHETHLQGADMPDDPLRLVFGGHRPGLACVYAPKGVAVHCAFSALKQMKPSAWESNLVVLAADFADDELAEGFAGHPDIQRRVVESGMPDLGEAMTYATGGVVVLDSITAFEAMAGITRQTPKLFRDLRKVRDAARRAGTMLIACGTYDLARKRTVGSQMWTAVAGDHLVLSPRDSLLGQYRLDSVSFRGMSTTRAAVRGGIDVWVDESSVVPMPVDPSPQASHGGGTYLLGD
jgi:hypothetical protein